MEMFWWWFRGISARAMVSSWHWAALSSCLDQFLFSWSLHLLWMHSFTHTHLYTFSSLRAHTASHLQALAYALDIAGPGGETHLFVSQTSGWMRIFWMIINDKPAYSPWQPLYLLSLGPFHLNCKLWAAWVDGVSERDGHE